MFINNITKQKASLYIDTKIKTEPKMLNVWNEKLKRRIAWLLSKKDEQEKIMKFERIYGAPCVF
ncbi:MAG: hypothetical protein LBF97_01930 [Elusimicrobiota bacterium]|jgi:hypothetical protein|nr:hypothetical protein [Elusimicrobiota bacterium]